MQEVFVDKPCGKGHTYIYIYQVKVMFLFFQGRKDLWSLKAVLERYPLLLGKKRTLSITTKIILKSNLFVAHSRGLTPEIKEKQKTAGLL